LIDLREDISKSKKVELIKSIIAVNDNIPVNYISDAWVNLNVENIRSIDDVYNVMSKSWLVGFVEAEGSIYYTKKDSKRIVHCFNVTQKLDLIVLVSIKYIFNIKAAIQYHKKKNYYSLSTTNSSTIEYIINYFSYKVDASYFLGVKGFEFKIWKRTYHKFKGNYDKLERIRNWINKLRNKHKI